MEFICSERHPAGWNAIHLHLSIVFQSVNDRRATAVCMLMILLAISGPDTHIAIFCQIETWQVL